jgi:hypothetical protein
LIEHKMQALRRHGSAAAAPAAWAVGVVVLIDLSRFVQ